MSGEQDNGAPARERDERRSSGRHPVQGVQGSFLFSTDAKILNLSLDGVALETTHYLQVGRRYELKLGWTGRSLAVSAKVVWCTLVRTTRNERQEVVSVYRAGLHLEEVLSQRAADLHRFIAENAVISLEKRLFGRFRVRPDGAAHVDLQAPFVVRRISQSGMLIEAEEALEEDARVEMELRLGEERLAGAAKVVRCEQLERPDGSTGFEIGVRFVELDEAGRRSLANFIHRCVAEP